MLGNRPPDGRAPDSSPESTRRTPLKEHELHVLLALLDQDLHGLAIQRLVLDASGGAVRLWPGKLYGTLRAFEERGWVGETSAPQDAEDAGGNPRWFALHEAGRTVLRQELDHWARLVEAGRSRGLGRGLSRPGSAEASS